MTRDASRAARRRKIYLGLWLGWMALTFLLTSIPDPGIEIPVPGADKLEHLGFYGVMAFFFALWRRESGASFRRAFAHALLFAAVAGLLDEAHQLWIPGRTAELLDWVADAAGGGCGALASGLVARMFPALVTE